MANGGLRKCRRRPSRDGKSIELSSNIRKEAALHLLETPLARNQVVVKHDDHYFISATAISTAHRLQELNGKKEFQLLPAR